MAKPGDFFVGVTDLFSVLLPGTVISFIAMKAEQSLRPPVDLFGLLQLKDAPGFTAFLVCSFLLGHLADMIGASFLDAVYDLLYADFKRSNAGFLSWSKQVRCRLWTAAQVSYRFHFRHPSLQKPEADPEKPEDPVYRAAKLAAAPKPDKDKLYQWCRDWLQARNPLSLQEPDRLQANSKFFRALVVVGACFGALFWTVPEFRASYSRSVGEDLLWTASCAFVTAAAFIRFSDLRWKAVQHVYRLYLIERYCEDNAGPSQTAPPARD